MEGEKKKRTAADAAGVSGHQGRRENSLCSAHIVSENRQMTVYRHGIGSELEGQPCEEKISGKQAEYIRITALFCDPLSRAES